MPEAHDLVWYTYWRYFGRRKRCWLELIGMEREDIYQEGMIGFLTAIRRFDPDRGLQFSTFAVPHILGAICRAFRERAFMVRLPRSVAEKFGRILTAQEVLAQGLGRMPTAAEVSAAARVTEEEAHACFAGALIKSLSAGVAENGEPDQDRTLGDTIPVPPRDDEIVSELAFRQALARLAPRARSAVAMKASGATQVQIAERLGCSQAQVSRILRAARQALGRELYAG